MAKKVGEIRDRRTEEVLYELAEAQGGYLTAQQAVDAGVPRSTLSYHAGDGTTLERVGHAVYRLRRFPSTPHGHVIAAWLALSRADAVVSHVSALELLDLTDRIADEVHITLPRSKRGRTVPDGVKAHYTEHPPTRQERRRAMGMPVTGVERTIADVIRADGWTEQVDLALRQALQRGQTTLPRLSASLPRTWQRRLQSAAAATGP
jgi:predicted transcriptional regulator of viral defense system